VRADFELLLKGSSGQGRQFFPGGGQNFDRLHRGGGAKYEKYKML